MASQLLHVPKGTACFHYLTNVQRPLSEDAPVKPQGLVVPAEPNLDRPRAQPDIALAVDDPLAGVDVPGGLEGHQGGP